MLVKSSDDSEESSVRISNFKNVNTNVSLIDFSEQRSKNDCSDSLILKPNLNALTDYKSYNFDEDIDGKYAVPEGYQVLPEELFYSEIIPPPLVSSSWLKLFYSDEDSGEDYIPLAKLKKKIKKKKRLKKNVESIIVDGLKDSNKFKGESENPKKQKVINEYPHIKRKRGRPKKQTTIYNTESSEYKNDEYESFWNDESDFSNHEGMNLVEVEKITSGKENSDVVINNYNEHDYFKPITNSVINEPSDGFKKEKKKKRKTKIQGVKIGNSKISFPCLECGKSFSAASTLKCHQRIHNGTLLICPECHRGFVSKYLLKCHMRLHNGDLFMCHKCGRGFTTAELLKVHSRAHTGDRPFICNVCGKSFPTSSNMLQHKQIHNSEKKFLCSECGSSFVQKRCLDYHMLTHAEKKNICNVCGKLWARKSDLIEHMRVHTGVKPYCCTICPQKFSQASSLKRHQLVHIDVKPISCGTCNKMFKCQEYYKRHLRKHEKEYLFTNI